jgi:hypothetical protein
MVTICTSNFNNQYPAFSVDGFCMILTLNSVKELMFLMVKYGVLFEVRTGFLNNI